MSFGAALCPVRNEAVEKQVEGKEATEGGGRERTRDFSAAMKRARVKDTTKENMVV